MSTHVLLSIKPVFVDRIFSGDKRYEFRKVLFRDKSVKKVFIYSSAPISLVVGEFHVDEILKLNPEKLWHITHQWAGISKEFFDNYFKNRDFGYAIRIGHVRRYNVPFELEQHFKLKQPPQSFAYVPNQLVHNISSLETASNNYCHGIKETVLPI